MGWLVAASAASLLGLLLLGRTLPARRARRRFLAGRELLSNAEFCEAVCRNDPWARQLGEA